MSPDSYRPYPAYRDSGVMWLGEIPGHWEVRKLRHVTSLIVSNVDKNSSADEYPVRLCNYTDVYNHEVISDGLDFMRATATADEIDRFQVRIGDVVITKDSETWIDIGVPALAQYEAPDFLCGYHLAIVRPRNVTLIGAFLLREFQSQIMATQLHVAANGITRYGLSHQDIKEMLLLVPPLPEQRAISAFLDRETAKLDALIAKKERLLALLAEKRAALISHAVTKGLDPSVPMRDSGVAWLGEIPAHWEVLPVKRVARIRYGLGQPPAEASNGLPLIRATNINSGRVTSTGMMHVDLYDVPLGRQATLRAGDIIVVRSGAYTGDSAIIPQEYEGSLAGYDLVVSITKGFSPFYAWQLLSGEVRDLQISFERLRAAQPHLNAEQLAEVLVTVPTATEEQLIAAYLDQETAKLDALSAKVSAAIEKLREYRAALIAAAVTGKIDVREAAVHE